MGGPGPDFASPSAVQPANLPQPGTDYPQGEFDTHDPKWTAKVPPTIEVWAHDETAQAGKTYHYRIVYKVRNPIYGAFNVAEHGDAERNLLHLAGETAEIVAADFNNIADHVLLLEQ